MTWHPYLPEPQPAVVEPGEPEPVALELLYEARRLCAGFRIPPQQFRRRTRKGEKGAYYPAADIVAVDPARAAADGMGGDDGYYVTLLHELLHATGHPTRLARATTGDFSTAGYNLEEGTALRAQRIVLQEIGFRGAALEWHAPKEHGLLVDGRAARNAADWLLQSTTEQLTLFPHRVGTETARCDHCGEYYRASEEPDPCIGRFLAGVAGCCCGHGNSSRAYVDLDTAWDEARAATEGKSDHEVWWSIPLQAPHNRRRCDGVLRDAAVHPVYEGLGGLEPVTSGLQSGAAHTAAPPVSPRG